MARFRISIFLLFISLAIFINVTFITKSHHQQHQTDLRESILDQTDLSELILDQTDGALRITKHVMFNDANSSNFIFSPPSFHVVLSMIAAGSEGQTLDQMLSFMKSTSTEDLNAFCSHLVSVVLADGSHRSNGGGGPKLLFANGVWIDKSLKYIPVFKQVLDSAYKAASRQADFQNKADEATKEVNLWTEKATSGLIKEILPPGSVDKLTRLIFANAVYYKGAWEDKFDPSKTKDGDFHLLNGGSVQVPFMTSKKKQALSAFDGFKVLRLRYKKGSDGRQFSMYFFLPDAKDGLSHMAEKLTSGSPFLKHHLPSQRVEVGDFKIPRFKFSFGFEAKNVLKALGLVLPFSPGGLTGMVDSPSSRNLYVSDIFHKSFIEVNEEGTEAAASTAAVVVEDSLQLFPDKMEFVADHPFLFMIIEELTGVVLCTGHILNPLEEG